LFDVEDMVKLSSSEESEKDVLWLWMESGGFAGEKFKLGITGHRGARFFSRLLVRGARIRFGYMRW
jgi:hypothetical protein